MRQFTVKERMMTFGDMLVQDQHGRTVLSVHSNTLTARRTFSFLDPNGEPIASVTRRGTLFRPSYEVEWKEQKATVRKVPVSVKYTTFEVVTEKDDSLSVTADVLQHRYIFIRNNQPVARVSQKHLTMSRTYLAEIMESEDAFLVLAVLVAIAQMR